ncbi:Para-aminobenzoate synthase, aminase component [hydrothermal vent metagenome]|uniref:Para-aminobenzoate synthase, aminase component n=1 Tax=hydrothermal vent metagenome TaxID=652676 RepID=A0A1W1CD02_9ZZZZ
MLTPIEINTFDLLSLHKYNPKKYPFLLESSTLNHLGRYSFLFANPSDEIVLKNHQDFDFFEKINKKIKIKNKKSSFPFIGGWVLYLSYEMNAIIEPKLTQTNHTQPLAYCVRIPSAIIIDHKKGKTYLIDEENSNSRLKSIQNDINQLKEITTTKIQGTLTQENPDIFIKNIKKCKQYLKQGDIFQANLSREYNFKLSGKTSSVDIYQNLRLNNPAPFSALINYQNFEIISSSPERLFLVDNNIIETRPIAGTNINKDVLENSHKEKAEHIMLVDLERNDLGKICEFSSIKTNELMTIEKLPFVFHLASNIQGKIKKEIQIGDIIKALFPGGSITGCPKVRCMEIIKELENKPRGAYTGSFGYISHHGRMDFNILIRTIVKEQQNLTFRAGAGIVYDSIAKNELEETQHKAKGLISSLCYHI